MDFLLRIFCHRTVRNFHLLVCHHDHERRIIIHGVIFMSASVQIWVLILDLTFSEIRVLVWPLFTKILTFIVPIFMIVYQITRNCLPTTYSTILMTFLKMGTIISQVRKYIYPDFQLICFRLSYLCLILLIAIFYLCLVRAIITFSIVFFWKVKIYRQEPHH